MDLYRPKCREPWDNDTFHEVAEELGSTYAKVAAVFRSQGCGAAFRGSAYDPHHLCHETFYFYTRAEIRAYLRERFADVRNV